jgi:amidohydrolase
MDAQELRHRLHSYPELSGKEFETHKLLHRLIAELKPDALETVGETGLIATFEGKTEGDAILIRADIDALPIAEPNELSYRSTIEGQGHKCGHDGHTAILYRCAQLLKEHTPERGKVHLLFQPSEENGQGAAKVLADENFAKYSYQYAYALHNIPGAPLGTVLCKTENFNAGVCSLSFEYQGLETHAAHPWEGKNPAGQIAELVQWALNQEEVDPKQANYFLCTPVYSHLGAKNYGISPGIGGLHFTSRAWDGELLNDQVKALQAKAEKDAKAAGVDLKFERFEEFWPVINNADSKEHLMSVCQKLGINYQELDYPYSWGEDFGLLLKDKKGLMFGLGSGEDCPVLHHPEYDFPDALIEKGASIFMQLIADHKHG